MSEARNEQHKCSICMDVLGANGGVSTLECGHPFCSECLARWEARSTLCPVCRADQRTLGRRARNREQGIEEDEDEPSQEDPRPPLEQLNELMNQLTQLMHNSHLQVQPGPQPLGELSPGLHTFPGGVQYAWGSGSGSGGGSTLHFGYPRQQRRQHGGTGQEQDSDHAENLYRDQLRRVCEAFGLPPFLEGEEQHQPEEPSAEPEEAASPAAAVQRAEDAINVLQVRLDSLPQRPWYLAEEYVGLEGARQSLQRCRGGSLPPHEARRTLQTVTGNTHLIERQLEDLLEARDAMERQRQGQSGSSGAAPEAAAGGGSAQPASSAPPLEALLGAQGEGDAQPPPRTERESRRWWAQQQDHPHPVYHASGHGTQRVPMPQASGQSQPGLQQQQQAVLSGRHQQQATPSPPAASEEEESRWGWGALAAGAAAVGAAAISSWWKGRNQGQQQQQQEGQFSAGQQASASGRQRGAQVLEPSAQTNACEIIRRLYEAQQARQGEGPVHIIAEGDNFLWDVGPWLREQPAEEGQPASRNPDVMALLLSAYEAYRARQASGAHNA